MARSTIRMIYITRSNAGFTLLELIISIVLLALIVLVTAGGMRVSYRSVDKGERKIESLERYRASLDLIDAQTQSAAPLSFDEDGTKQYYFDGTADTMRLATNYSIWEGQRGYVVVQYTVQPDESGMKSLYAAEGVVGTKSTRETKLLQGLDEISFEYYFKDPTEEEGIWIDEWKDNTTIPQKIRLRLVEGSKEIALIIPMRAQGALTQ